MNAFRLEPHDTLFLRDGRPFNQGEGVTGRLDGSFPPNPGTVVGAIRAAYAHALGWNGGAWPAAIVERLGDGDRLAPLRFRGPHLLRRSVRGDELLLPAPRHLAIVGETGAVTLLRPSDTLIDTDLGPTRLPVPNDPTRRIAPVESGFVTVPDAQRIFAGEAKDVKVIPESDLWDHEQRIGILRDVATRATGDDALYQTRHVRVRPGIGLLVTVTGLPDVPIPARYRPLGGESRAVWLEALPAAPTLPVAPALNADSENRVRYTVTLLTPASLGDAWQRPNAVVPGLPGRLVSACTGRMLRIGGWDGVLNQPKPLRAYVAPGSTLFLEAHATDVESILALHGHSIGAATEWGFGQLLIGSWRSS